MAAGGEVVAGAIEEGDAEVEEQVDEQRPRILRQEDLRTDGQMDRWMDGGGARGTVLGGAHGGTR